MSRAGWRLGRAGRQLGYRLRRHLYRDTNTDPSSSILLAGAARSGTTWLAEALDAQVPLRLMFEPFHPHRIDALKGLPYFPYLRPEARHDALRGYAETVLTGRIRHPWVDRRLTRLSSRRRLIKEVRANLMLAWMHRNFPEVPLLLIVRHPCAVVASRMRLGWATDSDIAPFLEQPRLLKDHLGPFEGTIRGARSDAQKHAIIWCVSQLVPLRQCADDLLILYYEDLCTDPEAQLRRVMQAIDEPFVPDALSRVDRPSATAQHSSAVVTGVERIGAWRSSLSSSQADEVLEVVRSFGLDGLYGDSLSPCAGAPGR